MTIPRARIREGFFAGAAYTLAAYALAAGALLLFLHLSRADAKPVTYANGTNSFIDPVALAAIPEPAPLALPGAGLICAHLALRRRRRQQIHQINARHRTAPAANMA